MIFNIDEKVDIIKILKETCGFNRGIIISSSYNEDENIIDLEMVYDNYISEANISSSDIGIGKRDKERFIMITGINNVSHGGRMKISKIKKRINKNTSHSDYISMHYDGKKIVHEPLTNINMSNKEFKEYENLFMRNINLINLAQDSSKMQYVDSALIRDETMRKLKHNVVRDKNGLATIYNEEDENKIDYIENLEGEIIYDYRPKSDDKE